MFEEDSAGREYGPVTTIQLWSILVSTGCESDGRTMYKALIAYYVSVVRKQSERSSPEPNIVQLGPFFAHLVELDVRNEVTHGC